jgi:hypothetical protein
LLTVPFFSALTFEVAFELGLGFDDGEV